MTGNLEAAYSQFELHPSDGGHITSLQGVGLVSGEFGDHAVLTTPREYGPIAVEVQVLDAPAPLDPTWDSAVEFSMRAGHCASVQGWAGSGRLDIPVPARLDVRVRYVVIGGEQVSTWSEETDPESERYLLQLWPAPPAPPAPIAATTPWSQYWAFGPAAEALVATLAGVPDPDRLAVIIDRALADHPDVTAHLRAGRDSYQSGVVRYAQEFFRTTHSSGAYEHIRNDAESLRQLITARAATTEEKA